MKLALIIGLLALAAFPALTEGIENSEEMPHRLNTEFIEEIWQEVIRATNEEAKIMKVDTGLRPPRIRYDGNGPAKLAEIEVMVEKKSGEAILARPRVVNLYPSAFRRFSWSYAEQRFIDGGPFPEQAYGAIAQEFFHETLLHQHVALEFHHCAMIYRGTLEKVLRMIDGRLGTGDQVTDSILGHTQGQCEKDTGLRFK